MSNTSSETPKRPYVRLYVDELEDPRRLALPDHLQAIHLLLLVHSVREDAKHPWTKGRDGEVLISVAEMAELRECSTSTINRAHRALVQKGFCCRKNGKLSVLRVAVDAAPDAHGAAPNAPNAAPDARKAARDAPLMCISCRPNDEENEAVGSPEASVGKSGNDSESFQNDQNVSSMFISHGGTATTDDELGFSLDEEELHEDDGSTPAVPHHQAVAVAVAPEAPEVQAPDQRRDDGDVAPPIPPPPPAVIPLEPTAEVLADSGWHSSGGITLESYLIETVGVSKSGVDEILALGIDDLRIRQASVFALDKATSNPGAYLRSCLRNPASTFWADARRVWATQRESRQPDIDAVIGQHGLFARQSVTASLAISDTDVFALDLTFDNGMTLEAAMVAMYLGRSAGARDNDVLGGVVDFEASVPSIRLLANYGEPLTRAFLAAAGKEPVLAPPELEQAIRVATERFPDVLGAFDGRIVAELVSAAEAAERQLRATQEAEARRERERREAEAESQRLRESPRFDPLSKDQGLVLEMGEVLNEQGVVGLLLEYGIPAGWQFLRLLYKRRGKDSGWPDHAVTATIDELIAEKDAGSIRRIIDATGENAPYPVGFFHGGNSWMRYFPRRFGPPMPEYRQGEMRDYTSLTDESTDDWGRPQPPDPGVGDKRSGRAKADW